MKCPHCNYESDGVDEYGDKVHNFYALGIEAKQKAPSWAKYRDSYAEVYGCPQCGIMFMNINP